jgi:hypothetical protein
MKKTWGIALVLTTALLMGGCAGGANQTESTTAGEESPVKTLSGTVMVSGKTISLTNQGVITEITSRKVDLTQYNGKQVSVTGQFSGSTLYVDQVD